MKNSLTILLMALCLNSSAQSGLILFQSADTLTTKTGERYAVEIISDMDGVITYRLTTDDQSMRRKVNAANISQVYRSNSRDNKAYQLDTIPLKGKEIFMQAQPLSMTLSKYYMLSFDIGVGQGTYLLTDNEGQNIKFFSEMACINYLIGQGWQLYQIMRVEKGSVGGAASVISGSAVGGSVNISSNIYYLKKSF